MLFFQNVRESFLVGLLKMTFSFWKTFHSKKMSMPTAGHQIKLGKSEMMYFNCLANGYSLLNVKTALVWLNLVKAICKNQGYRLNLSKAKMSRHFIVRLHFRL